MHFHILSSRYQSKCIFLSYFFKFRGFNLYLDKETKIVHVQFCFTANNSVSLLLGGRWVWRWEREDGEEGDEEMRGSDYVTINWSSDYYTLL